MLCLKFQENRIINEEFDFWRGGGKVTPIHKFNVNYYWQTCENVLFQISAKSHHK